MQLEGNHQVTATAGATSTSNARLADATRLGAVHLTVTGLDRSIGFYESAIGLRLHHREDGRAAMGAGGEDLVVLHEDPAASRPGRHAGLYHFALLFPTRQELARAALRLVATRVPLQGASDHGTHEAIYLGDPDGNGIELAADRPRGEWPDISGPGGYGAGPAPLDVDELLTAVAGQGATGGAETGLRIGHVHLHVGDLDAGTRFYRDGLGFEVMTDLGTAIFLSAGGYHHHVAINVWRGRGAPPPSPDAVGLRHWTLVVAGDAELAAVRAGLSGLGVGAADHPGGLLARDPSATAVLVVAGGGGAGAGGAGAGGAGASTS
jgi:catechol 2,3-dioxygenase